MRSIPEDEGRRMWIESRDQLCSPQLVSIVERENDT